MKVISIFISNFISELLNRLIISCPDKRCKGKLHEDFFDAQFDKTVYKCDTCRRAWI